MRRWRPKFKRPKVKKVPGIIANRYTGNVEMPENYVAMKLALRRCARNSRRKTALTAIAAMEAVDRHDGCEAIADDKVRLSTYCALADDNELKRLVSRVEAKLQEWM